MRMRLLEPPFATTCGLPWRGCPPGLAAQGPRTTGRLVERIIVPGRNRGRSRRRSHRSRWRRRGGGKGRQGAANGDDRQQPQARQERSDLDQRNSESGRIGRRHPYLQIDKRGTADTTTTDAERGVPASSLSPSVPCRSLRESCRSVGTIAGTPLAWMLEVGMNVSRINRRVGRGSSESTEYEHSIRCLYTHCHSERHDNHAGRDNSSR